MFVASLLASIASIVGWSSDPVSQDALASNVVLANVVNPRNLFRTANIGYMPTNVVRAAFLTSHTGDHQATPGQINASFGARANFLATGEHKVSALSIAGTNTAQQWVLNFGTVTCRKDGYNAMAMHASLVLLEQWIGIHSYSIWGARILYVTGHSQGGGLSEIVARVLLALRNKDTKTIKRFYDVANHTSSSQANKPLRGAEFLLNQPIQHIERVVLVAVSSPQWLPPEESRIVNTSPLVTTVRLGRRWDIVMCFSSQPLLYRPPHPDTQYMDLAKGLNPHCLHSMEKVDKCARVTWSLQGPHRAMTEGFLRHVIHLEPLTDT